VVPEDGLLTNTYEDFRASKFDKNCYWKVGGNVSTLRFGNTEVIQSKMHSPDWAEWRATGQDSNSVLADPQLEWRPVASLGGVLVPTPAASSPVWALGFKPIDIAMIGPQKALTRMSPLQAAPAQSCSEATQMACPGLFGDDCMLCAGQHYSQLQQAGCNNTSIEDACNHVTPAAALGWLEELSDWIVALDIGSGTLSEGSRTCSPCSSIESRSHIFVNGNLARVALATWRLQEATAGRTGNETLLTAGLSWCDNLCDQQATITTSKGNIGGFWGVGYPVLGPRGSIYFGDTGTAVTTLALGWHLSNNATQKARFLETMERYAAFVLEGSNTPPPGKNGTCSGFISPPSAGMDAGAVGCGYYSHRPSVDPYTIATGTTGAAFFSELFTITGKAEYAAVVNGSIEYLARVLLPSGEIPYILDGLVSGQQPSFTFSVYRSVELNGGHRRIHRRHTQSQASDSGLMTRSRTTPKESPPPRCTFRAPTRRWFANSNPPSTTCCRHRRVPGTGANLAPEISSAARVCCRCSVGG
jgi:hypothetical protein